MGVCDGRAHAPGAPGQVRSKALIAGQLYCDRETEHPGSHRDDTEGVYWIETAPALEYLEVGPPATVLGSSVQEPEHTDGSVNRG